METPPFCCPPPPLLGVAHVHRGRPGFPSDAEKERVADDNGVELPASCAPLGVVACPHGGANSQRPASPGI